MLTAEQYARIQPLMCMKNIGACSQCPFYNHTDENGENIDCIDFTLQYPVEAVKIVHIWWEENRNRYPEYDRRKESSNENDR